MLSNENPPPDSSFPCEISQLKSIRSSSNGDERASADKLDVDLLKSSLDENHQLPKFSIRDYVFQERAKDIKNSWPFSQQNLHLCLKHGVQDVLPPFQSPDSVRNSPSDSSIRGTGEKLAVDIEIFDPEEDKELSSTTRSPSCSGINSVSPSKDPALEPVGKPEFAIRVALKKVQSNITGPVKKSRLTLKLSRIAEPTPDEVLVANTSLASEPMASQVCPVCRIFSSSSNTTLNAHIDQCLSEEPTIKSQTNSKVIKHKIKARKVRLMVDIYETALCCTLEDLDKRNGTNWASNTSLPAQNLDTFAEEKNKACSLVHREGINDEGGVYIDSNGMKLRILSRLSDMPSNSNANDDCNTRKLGDGYNGNKPLSSKKRKYLLQEQKFLNPSPCRRGSSFSRISIQHAEPEITDQEKDFMAYGLKEDPTKSLRLDDSIKSDKQGRVKEWVGSKRTGQKKKINPDTESTYPEREVANLNAKSALSSLGDMVKRNSASKSAFSTDKKQLVPREIQKTDEISSYSSPDGFLEQIYLRKRPGFSSAKHEECLLFSKSSTKHLSKDSSLHGPHVGSPNIVRNIVPSRSKKKSGINDAPAVKGDCSFIRFEHPTFPSTGKESASLRTTSSGLAVSSENKKFSPLRKKLSSIRHDSVRESRKNLRRKRLHLKKHLLNYTSGSDKEIFMSGSVIYYRKYNLVETGLPQKSSDRSSVTRSNVLKLRKKRWCLVSTDKANTSSNDSERSLDSDRSSFGNNTGSDDVPDASNLLEEADRLDESTCEPTYEIADGEAFVAYSKSLDSADPAGPSNVQCGSHNLVESYEGRHPCELVFAGGEILHTDKLGQHFVTPNSHVLVEMDSQKHSYVDVDPIPIPGPPGSFLPSPGRVGSEGLQGNSSLTTCRIHSSEDEREVVDVDSSDSPISATSSLSNSIPTGTHLMNLDMHFHVQHPPQGVISESRTNPVVEGTSVEKEADSLRQDINLHESRTNVIFPNVSTHEFNNSQPCCCLRKDVTSRNASLNYRESQFMEQRTAIGDDPNAKGYFFSSISSMGVGGSRALVSRNSEAKPTPICESGSPNPSASNPVLRLMGKNLMVVNKDDPQNQSTSCRMASSSLYTDINRNEIRSSYPTSSRGFSIPTQYFHDYPPNGFKDPANFWQPVMFSSRSTAMLSNNCVGGGFASSSKGYEHADGCNLIPEQISSIVRSDAWRTYDNEQLLSSPPGHNKTSVNALYGYQTRGVPLSTVSLAPPGQTDPNMTRWNCTPEGSWIHFPNPQTAPLPRSSLHFSPGFF